jgi:DNA invertase Pin-like site-specific DNA recombinase
MKPATKYCAVYTRKSTDERLEMEFNSLDAQRESCLAYIASQKAEGWQPVKKLYDDGGFSGRNIGRPALTELLADIKAGKVNIVVVYKIDRLTRSLMDFAKLVEIFDGHGVTFVSVTQSFNTTTSMGRLTLNVLLSFAQFEREVAGERIRDKIAASKRKGMFMGGVPPLGYRVENRQLLVDEQNAKITKHIFERYLALGSTLDLAAELKEKNIKSPDRVSEKGLKYDGAIFSKGALHQILTNPMYIGKTRHKDALYDGQHKGIISVDMWSKVQDKLQNGAVSARGSTKAPDESLLRKILVDADGRSYRATFTNKSGKRYRYYACEKIDGAVSKLPAHEIETIVENDIRSCLCDIKKTAEIFHLDEEYDNYLLNKIIECSPCIPTSDLLGTAVKKVILTEMKVIISLDMAGLRKLILNHAKADFPNGEFKSTHELVVPYKKTRASKGAIVIKPEGGKKDMLDLPPQELKKLIQGFAWRDEHFNGLTIRQIAQREKVSDSYVGTQIFQTFEVR